MLLVVLRYKVCNADNEVNITRLTQKYILEASKEFKHFFSNIVVLFVSSLANVTQQHGKL